MVEGIRKHGLYTEQRMAEHMLEAHTSSLVQQEVISHHGPHRVKPVLVVGHGELPLLEILDGPLHQLQLRTKLALFVENVRQRWLVVLCFFLCSRG